jgi:hypothetical protein
MMAVLQPEAADAGLFLGDLISNPNLNRPDGLPRDQGALVTHSSA